MEYNGTTTPAQRHTLLFEVEFKRNYARRHTKANMKNVSLTGAFLENPENLDLEKDEKINLNLFVGGRARTLQATVIWKNHLGCGVRFAHSNNRDLQIIDDLIFYVESTRASQKSVLADIFKKVS
jgi:hypothetical protein